MPKRTPTRESKAIQDDVLKEMMLAEARARMGLTRGDRTIGAPRCHLPTEEVQPRATSQLSREPAPRPIMSLETFQRAWDGAPRVRMPR